MAKAARIAGEPPPPTSNSKPPDEPVKDVAFDEALRRYAPSGDVLGALIFYKAASSAPGTPSADELAWARKVMSDHGR